MATLNLKKKYYPPFIVIPMSIDKDGRGPEMDESKVVKTVYEIWDSACQTVAEFNNEPEALGYIKELNSAQVTSESTYP